LYATKRVIGCLTENLTDKAGFSHPGVAHQFYHLALTLCGAAHEGLDASQFPLPANPGETCPAAAPGLREFLSFEAMTARLTKSGRRQNRVSTGRASAD
jgi:hypothetical protein